MTFDILTTPFSYKGSFWAFNTYLEENSKQLYLKNVRESCSKTNYKLFKLEVFYNGLLSDYTCTACAHELIICGENYNVDVFFVDEDTIGFYTENSAITLKFTLLFNGGYSYFYNKNVNGDDYTVFNLPQNRINLAVRAECGTIAPQKDKKEISFLLTATKNGFYASLSEFEVEMQNTPNLQTPEICKNNAKQSFDNFAITMLPTKQNQMQSRYLAAYILWSCHVKQSRFLPRDAIYMSKNDMCNIWSWDNCMIAIALAYGQAQTALNQLLIPLDYQDEHGAVPDLVNDVFCLYNFCKPPIYGWALNKIEKHTNIDYETLKLFYDKISKNTKWWYSHRDSDNDYICEYLHGNDSGWDNSTLFLGEPPVETPDLQTFLILQMDYLISCCKRLNLADDLTYWQNLQSTCLSAMIEHCFLDDFSVAKKSGTHEMTLEKSLICFIPLMLGERLPENIRKKLLHELKNGNYITNYGLATEPLNSPHYKDNGYWQGPIWGISTVMITEALERCGEKTLATEIAEKFVKLVAQSGMAENFNAVTGAPLKDKAFTWTSACYFYLSNRYLP